MTITVFTDVFTLLNDAAVDIIANDVSSIMSMLKPMLLVSFTIYVMFVFISYFETNIGQSMWDILKRICAWGFILTFSLNIGSYTATVVPFVTGLGDSLASLMSGGSEIDSSLNNLAVKMIEVAGETWDSASGIGESTMAALGIIIIIVFGTVFLVVASAYIILAKLFLAILAILGPIFIVLALFPATRQFFSSWVNQVINYSLLILILSLISSLFITFIENIFVNKLGATFDMDSFFLLPAILGIFTIILLRVPDLAAGLSSGMGGMASGTNAIASVGGAAGGKAAGAAGAGVAKGASAVKTAIANRFGGGNSLKAEKDGK